MSESRSESAAESVADGVADAVAEGCADAVVEACGPVVERHYHLICCILLAVAILAVIAIGLAVAFAVAHPVIATVEAASLSRLALDGNGTTPCGLSLTLAVRNPNVALRARHAAPLDADIRVAGRRFGTTVSLADAGQELHAKEKVRYHVKAAGTLMADDLPTPLGSGLPVEVALAGEVTYRPVHRGRHALAAICTLKLQLPPPPGATLVAPEFHRIRCVRA